jgi:hypothetical protein
MTTNPTFAPAPDSGAILRSNSEAGSAYLATLLILVVLTILGLSLAVITQTEVLIGGSEKQATRQLYSAGSGLHMAAAYELVARDSGAHQLRLGERDENIFGATTKIVDDICTSPIVQIHDSVCNLCTMNQDTEYVAAQYGVSATALRGGDATLGARKELGMVIAFEPFQRSIGGLQFSGDDRIKPPADPTIDIDPSTEVDPCEGLYIKL